MLKAWREIVAGDAQCIVVVSHGGAIRALLCHLLGRPLDALFTIAQDYGAINVVACDCGGCRVLRINGRADELVGAAGQTQPAPRAIKERKTS
jgi:broad specificity phosphatase PhoE